MDRRRYREGDWFAVPIDDGGYATGIVARGDGTGVCIGYFFGPAHDRLPTASFVRALAPRDAVLVGAFGDLGIIRGVWPLLGRCEPWDRTAWPMPVFARYEELTGRGFHVSYDEDHPNRVVREVQVPPGLSEQLPRDGLMRFGFVQARLTRLLRPS